MTNEQVILEKHLITRLGFPNQLSEEGVKFVKTKIVPNILELLGDEKIKWVGSQVDSENFWSVVPIKKQIAKEFWEVCTPKVVMLLIFTKNQIIYLNLIRYLSDQVSHVYTWDKVKRIKVDAGKKQAMLRTKLTVIPYTKEQLDVIISKEDYQNLLKFIEASENHVSEKIF